MAYRKETYYTDHDKPARAKRTEYVPKHTEHQYMPSYHLPRSTDPERGVRRRSSKHNRTATGYINRRSCPSYPYITKRSHSPDPDFIARPPSYSDEYIQPCEQHHDSHASHQPRDSSHAARWNVQAFSSKEAFMRAHGLEARDDEDLMEVRRSGDGSYRANAQGSDVEDIVPCRASYERDRRRKHDSEHEAGSDVVGEKRTSVGSDIASIHSRRSSYSPSHQRPIRNTKRGEGFDIQERRGSSDTDSDYEDGYISLDDHIGGGSDCVSNRSLSEDRGEGSDAVSGCEMEQGSDVVDASDVEDFDEGEDCIQDTHSSFCQNDVYYRA
ncbi:uncharacterized protein EKO05_0007330 [Ascochyta rabiei]|uniref:Uncharacterized protein n=1 Tax=Didymella rabiei TaxID=5454 RepID=A0A162WYU2_DIDRA|nr:uncharacterized protein EKO05_0007330 [Ascochyta rabiei]KZM19268.1 hypothetical protein ST47_g9607 [Ascochyta rabiei]UPX16950.1 hypothetical protein EKO05_0007330 [Ascochyta rabiei]